MALHSSRLIAAVLLLAQLNLSQSAKNNARPVHEIINEQARIDDKLRLSGSGSLPYGNPLAGNSQHNARLHAQNQQAMYNAEKIRQHRAQIQRWTKAPLRVDSYMKAYHESQESHQLAVEQAQANIREKKHQNPTPKLRQHTRPETLKRGVKVIPEVTRITKADAIIKENNRNHRSHGSLEYHQYLEPKMYKSVYISPAPTYDQGVTIKPNGNVGLTSSKPTNEESKLFTEAIPSKTRYVYPKQYSQMQNYKSAKDIEALSALLKKPPQAQISELNALIHPEYSESKDVLETPIDLYFYAKDTSPQSLPNHYEQTYAQIPPTYASAYMPEVKDHTPITEEVDDIENPNKSPKVQQYGIQSVLATQIPETETTTTKSNNYYKVEVASQVISAGYKPSEINQLIREDEKHYEHYTQPLAYHLQKNPTDGDLSQRYLHHNALHQGIQHLSEDGTGVSAYDNENVSTKPPKADSNRNKRSLLEPTPFSLPKTAMPLTERSFAPKNNTPKAEPLIRINPLFTRPKEIATFLTTPTFPIGVATDFISDDYEEVPRQRNRFNRDKLEFAYDDEENDFDDDVTGPDYEYGVPNYKQSSLLSITNPRHNYAPSIGYNQNADLSASYSNRYGNIKRYPTFSNNYRGVYPSGVGGFGGQPLSTAYGVPQTYGTPLNTQYGPPLRYGVPNNVIEPMYMLTQTQLKNLIGHHNLNIQHLDVFQYPSAKIPFPKHNKRYPYRRGNAKRHIQKLRKLNIL